jgi:hypothetical protein
MSLKSITKLLKMGIFCIDLHKESRGILLVDILIAFTLATLFIVIMSQSSSQARVIFETAKQREQALDVYSANVIAIGALLPDSSIDLIASSSSVGNAYGRWYGNEMMEIVSDNYADSSTSSGRVIFRAIRGFDNSESSFKEIETGSNLNIGGAPVCSVNFGNNNIVGSYEYEKEEGVGQNSAGVGGSNGGTTTDFQISAIHLPIDATFPLTDLEIRNGIAYVSSDSNISADPDLFIFDIKNISNVRLISSLNTGPGLSSLALAGKRIYASAPSTVAQLHTIRLDSLSTPVLENRYRLPLPYATATPALGSSIFYNSRKVYLGTEKWDGEEYNVIDVTKPNLPAKLSGYEIGSKVNEIFSYKSFSTERPVDFAYVTASSRDQLLVFDASDPARSDLAQTFSPSGWERQEGKVVSLFEQRLGLGRTTGGFDLPSDHEVFVWATTSASTLVDYISVNNSGGVYGFLQDRSYVYLATRQPNKELQILDRNLSTTTANFALPIAPQVMTCDGDSIFILANRAPFIYKLTSR